LFFPDVERITGDVGLMSRNVEQHHTFLPGLEAFEKYTKGCIAKDSEDKYDGEKFRSVIRTCVPATLVPGMNTNELWSKESFAPALAEHLSDEITTLSGLGSYTEKVAALKEAYVKFDLKLREGDKVCSLGHFDGGIIDRDRIFCGH
jgi:hypothetical protein